MFDNTGAKCLGGPDVVWGHDGIPEEWQRQLCRSCPLFDICLDWAIRHEEHGIWAGTSWSERGLLRSGNMRAKCPMCAAPEPWNGEGDQVCAFCGFGWPVRRRRAEPAR